MSGHCHCAAAALLIPLPAGGVALALPQHEKIIRGVAVGLALVQYGREEAAEGMVEQMTRELVRPAAAPAAPAAGVASRALLLLPPLLLCMAEDRGWVAASCIRCIPRHAPP